MTDTKNTKIAATAMAYHMAQADATIAQTMTLTEQQRAEVMVSVVIEIVEQALDQNHARAGLSSFTAEIRNEGNEHADGEDVPSTLDVLAGHILRSYDINTPGKGIKS